MPHAGAASLIDGVDDGGMWSGERKLAHAGCAERAVLAGVFEVDQLDVVRDVLDVGQTGANERGVLLDILIVLGQGEADALPMSAIMVSFSTAVLPVVMSTATSAMNRPYM